MREYEAMAMLDLDSDERSVLGERFNVITAGFTALEHIDTDGVAPLVSVLDMHNILREDVAVKSFSKDEILANAPEQYDGFFQVPGTLE